MIHPKSINAIHKGRARDSVIDMCLVLVKMYGISPKKLLKTMNLNRETNMIVLPGLVGPRRVLNSLCRDVVTEDHINEEREGIAQNG